MVDRLITRGLVQRLPGVDRRSVGLSLTAAGRSLVPVLSALADQNDRRFFCHLSDSERDALLGTIHKLLAANNWDHDSRGHDQLT
jgi:DNA-binding MarR family transcriptional regulator